MQSTQTIRRRFSMSSLLASATVCLAVGCDLEALDTLDDPEDLAVETGADYATSTGEPAVPHQLVEEDGMIIATGDDFRVRIHRTRRVAELNVSREQVDDWYRKPFSRWSHEATGRLYEVFADDFDFIVFVPASEGQHPAVVEDGQSVRVQNHIEGLGLALFDDSANWGSAGHLQSTIFLGGIKHIVGGPSLRELGERWGNAFVPSNYPDHFGFSDVGGLLGGCSPDEIEPLGHDTYTCDFNGSNDWSPDGAIHNDRLYARLELYLMGLVSPKAVPPVTWIEDGQWVDANLGIFHGTLHNTDIDGFLEMHGERVPAHDESQREFRTLFVVISGGDFVDLPLFHSLDDRVSEFAAPEAVLGEPGLLNFYEATSGLATLVAEKLDASLL